MTTPRPDSAAPPARVPAWWLLALLAVAAVVGLLVYEAELAPVPRHRADEVRIAEVGYDGLAEAVSARKGKVVVVEFWATWCRPCRANFPNLVRTFEAYEGRGVEFVSVALENDPAADRERALRFLKDKGAAFTNFIWTDRTPAGAAGLEGRFGYPGSIPYAALFGKDGARIRPPDGFRFTHDELVEAVERALAADAAAK